MKKSNGGRMKWFWVVALTWATMATHARASLLLQYSFDEAGTGATPAINGGSLGSAANGTFDGNATRTSSTPNNYSLGALRLNTPAGGFNSVGTSANIPALAPSTLTITTWLNVQDDRSLVYDVIASDQNYNLNLGWNFYFVRAAGDPNQRTLHLQVNAGDVPASVAVSGTNQWQFVAVTLDMTAPNTPVKFYIGDVSSAVAQVGITRIPTFASLTSNNANQLLQVGNNALGAPDRAPNAFMDDFRIYNTVLDSTALNAVRLSDLIPEPSAAVLLGVGALLLAPRKFRRE